MCEPEGLAFLVLSSLPDPKLNYQPTIFSRVLFLHFFVVVYAANNFYEVHLDKKCISESCYL